MFAEYSISVDKRRGSHEAEYLISVDKRRAPHEALAAEEPNPKRIETSAETLDPSLITLLVNVFYFSFFFWFVRLFVCYRLVR